MVTGKGIKLQTEHERSNAERGQASTFYLHIHTWSFLLERKILSILSSQLSSTIQVTCSVPFSNPAI